MKKHLQQFPVTPRNSSIKRSTKTPSHRQRCKDPDSHRESFSISGIRRPSAGFTLLELLSISAIIGILAALLIPAVQSMIKGGAQAQCTNNIRQITQALHQFAAENNGFLPAAKRNSTTTWTRDPDFISYLPRRKALNESGVTVDWENAVFICPSTVGENGRKGDRLRVTYAATSAILGEGGTDKTLRRNMYSINSPATTPLIYETKVGTLVNGGYFHTWSQVESDISSQNAASTKILDFLHRDSMNVGMVDGSVRRLTPADFKEFTEERWRGVGR